ncbi:SGNH/GDSL hydrolase family protein [Flavitalea flava]
MTGKLQTYLALGDSYTIGEGLLFYENFPCQTVQRLRQSGIPVAAPELIAKTGWTTDELMDGIRDTCLLPTYDFVSLLIGVNNEFRSRKLEEYQTQFETLLKQAIDFAGNKTTHVFVLSIPDWSVTPFANTYLPDTGGRNKEKIAGEIDAFNKAAQQISHQYSVNFLDITTHTRLAVSDKDLFASDGLHPSGKEYKFWAAQLAEKILAIP